MRARRDRRLFDSQGNEVLINLVCTGPCGQSKPFSEFGIRKIGGQLRSISQCSACRGRYTAIARKAPEPAPVADGAGLW